ncbi:glycosyltransferase family 2 protein [Oceanobacillus bengalensis]|uniref:Glycosyltransferase family 2 protein n=1 Tax=Oceanobacillus bengalensis TaxID=1435466 RepID=A0A494YSW6_9BACI|nr:glycosyltransferase family 2 protein [Oceanobacillus bengalensis]RKQ12961.1 glycosyltransferase family 2 protein [Oceanobacillus bengalensis]
MNKHIAGIVLYNPDIPRLQENIESIYKQVEQVILIDNGSKNIKEIKFLINRFEKLTLIENKQNKGIATALNQIVNYSMNCNFNWVLLLDQDSVSPLNIIDEFDRYTCTDEKVAIICPEINDRNSVQVSNSNNIEEYEYVKECITSGSFLNCSIWYEIGGFDEKMFIDYVDIEYCKRVIRAGFKILKVNRVELLHEIGKRNTYKFLWLNVPTYEHSAFRKYYITRNTLYFTRKYKEDENILYAYLKVIKRLIIVVLYEKDKWKKINAMYRGMRDSYKMI